MEVIQALRESSKGRLDYEKKLKNQPSLQKLHVLDTFNPLPPVSPEIESFVVAIRSTESEPSGEAEVESVSTAVSEDVDHPMDQSLESFSESSVVSDIYREQQDYEDSLDDRLFMESKEALEKKKNWFQLQLQQLDRTYREGLEVEQSKLQRRVKQSQESIKLEELRKSVAIEEWKQMTLEAYRTDEERVEAKLADGELQAKRITQLKQEQMKALCKQYRREGEQLGHEFSICFQHCKYPGNLPESVTSKQRSAIESCNALQVCLRALEQSGSHLHDNQVDTFIGQFNKLKHLLEHMRMAVEEANISGAEQAEKMKLEQKLKLEEEKRNKLKEQKLIDEQKHCTVPTTSHASSSEGAGKGNSLNASTGKEKESDSLNASTGKGKESDGLNASTGKGKGKESDGLNASIGKESESLNLGMPKSMISSYAKLQDALVRTISSVSSFAGSKDPMTKKYRFDLQKAVNTTINSISANSGESLIEKINQLQSLIGGQTVHVMGKTVSISGHPEARLYCSNLLAKKLVKQGEDQVSSNIEAAFPLAAVAIGLWSKYPELGELMLAHFHSTCPCLVPFYVPKTSDMTDADHLKLQGYKVSSDGKVETEDMFLHRVGGVVRLYAAIISSPQLPMDHMHSHPHGLNHGWAWLARVLNMDPHPTLTAAALRDFLEIAGHALMKKFGRQFRKLLYTLCRDFIPKMERCTPSSQRGPISRLTQLLETCITSGVFPEPKGYLHIGFWRTRTKGISYA